MLTTLVLASTLALGFALGPAHDEAHPPRDASDQDADAAALLSEGKDGRWYVFGEEELTGEVLGPEGQLIPWRRPARFESLIEIRGHFLPELLKLALDLAL